MSCLAVCENFIAVAKGLVIDTYDYSSHVYLHAPKSSQTPENDSVNDVAISDNSKYLAFITSTSKQLVVYLLPATNNEPYKTYTLPRSASKIRFTANHEQILVADKSGDVLIYNINVEDTGSKLLGHLSLLLDVIQTSNGKHIVSCDRDEKIRVSCFPNTYNIQTFCLGHKEFVNHIELLPHDSNILTSTSGDGTIKCWDYIQGKLIHSVDTFIDIKDEELKAKFCKIMDEEGVEVSALPIVHYTVAQLGETSSLLAVYVHSYNMVLFYCLQTVHNTISHKLAEKLTLDYFPTAIKFYKSSFFIYDDVNCNLKKYDILLNDDNVTLQFVNKINLFETNEINSESKENFESIKVLYKRKFDNVQEYQERKKQRLEKQSNK